MDTQISDAAPKAVGHQPLHDIKGGRKARVVVDRYSLRLATDLFDLFQLFGGYPKPGLLSRRLPDIARHRESRRLKGERGCLEGGVPAISTVA
ncbi:MAG: hypothetical protein ACRDPJ_08370 [Nocardioidaceae bacterium]